MGRRTSRKKKWEEEEVKNRSGKEKEIARTKSEKKIKWKEGKKKWNRKRCEFKKKWREEMEGRRSRKEKLKEEKIEETRSGKKKK